jgi:quinol-cytochrome oxidoreductase complex cytochrome b subunit
MSNPTTPERPPLSAILLDLRSVIGLLFVVYGVVLTILGIIGETPEELAKAGGLALNLWTGLAMLVAGIIFYVWAFTKPPMPPDPNEESHYEEGGPMHMGGH